MIRYDSYDSDSYDYGSDSMTHVVSYIRYAYAYDVLYRSWRYDMLHDGMYGMTV